VSNEQMEFADFFEASWDPCLRAVTAVVGSPQLAEDQVAEAFARAFASWRKVSCHPAPRAWVVRTALNTGASWWRRRSRELPLAGHDVTAPGDPGDGVSAAMLTARLRHDRGPGRGGSGSSRRHCYRAADRQPSGWSRRQCLDQCPGRLSAPRDGHHMPMPA
jgi:hypothetical protein